MEGRIFVVQADNSLVTVNRAPYDNEALLQNLLSDYPDLLAGDQMNTENPRRWLLISPELKLDTEADGTGGWWIDHLFLDQDSIPTIVEVKRSSDSRIRREVVGQMLEYAAHFATYWPAERIRAYFEERCKARNNDPDEQIHTLLEDMEGDIEAFWSLVGENITAGRLRLLFVADEMPVHLQRVVEFLNTYMSPIEVLAVEIQQFTGGDLKTLVPRVIGQTAQTQEKKTVVKSAARGAPWNEDRFFTELAVKVGPAELAVARNLFEWAKSLRVEYGKGKVDGSCFPIFDFGGRPHSTFSMWTYGRIEIQFEYMQTQTPFDDLSLRQELARQLNAIDGMPVITDDHLTRRPTLRFSILTNEASLSAFKNVFDWYLDTVRASIPE